MEPTALSHFLELLGRNSGEAGILVVLVLATQWLFRRQLTPRWRCALLHQPGQERARGLGMPRGVRRGQLLDDLIGSDRVFLPDDAHDFPFGIADAGHSFHRLDL